MKESIKLIVEIVNMIHDIVLEVSESAGFYVTDKVLHFWIIGFLGMFFFFFVHAIFKVLAEWSLTPISFFYTFTVLVVIVFAIEIEQKITGRGQMELSDAVVGLYGFLLLFGCYMFVKLLIKLILFFINKNNRSSNERTTQRYRSKKSV
ncbi:hypothetical protein [Anoxybacillus gonensis]|uniref:hypothetical protein n=1 Tax=Anoxybacillus gonensis TaxID=198467 RepID=UPI0002BF12D1|nr:hypothetical protein [Anoxybacillus gonensis]EMI09543.1 putative small membrane protein [Anoxybacillus gonensis]